jgi:hypothetical protein
LPSIGLDFKDFMSFFKARKEVLREKLKKVLALTSDRPLAMPAEWSTDDDIEPQERELAEVTIE